MLVRDAARACVSAYPKAGDAGSDQGGDAGLTQAKGAVQEVFATAERMAADLDSDVLWMSEGTERMPPRLCVAPLQVWGPMRDKLLADKTVVFTSATLMLGGDFAHRRPASAQAVERRRSQDDDGECRGAASTSAAPSTTASRRSSTSPATCRRPAATG